MGKSAPDAPDYRGAAEAQGESSLEQTRIQTLANRPDQFTPWGTSIWTPQADETWRQDITLSGPQQEALDSQMGVQAGRSKLAEGLINRAGGEVLQEPGWDALDPNQVGGASDTRQRAEDAIYNRAASRLDPQWEQAQEAKESQLWNQGLRPGDQAYDDAMGNFERGKTDAYQTATDASIMGGGAEGERDFGMDLSRRQQALAESLQRRGLSINEMNALLTGQQVATPNMPDFQRANSADPTNYLGAAVGQGQADLNAFNAEQAGMQGLFSGAGSIAAGAAPFFGFSDRRLKTDIRRIGHTPAGQSVYAYTIFGRPEVGVMADESPADAVAVHESGYLMVDYSRIK